MPVGEGPIELRTVEELAEVVARVVGSVRRELSEIVPGTEVEHVGATALGSGLTKGDVDVNLRVSAAQFEQVVESLAEQFKVAQSQNWTATYASFSDPHQELPVGIQVCVEGSEDDFLVRLRDRFQSDEKLCRQYDEVKRRAARHGAAAYWAAKDAFLRPLVGRA